MEVKFYDCMDVEDDKIKFAVIVARHMGAWVFCRHRERATFEAAGGHREINEAIRHTAERELFEETGAVEFTMSPVCVYSVTGKNQVNATGQETFGMLYYAEISRFGEKPESEIEEVRLLPVLPSEWTYPLIQPKLIEKVVASGFTG